MSNGRYTVRNSAETLLSIVDLEGLYGIGG